VNYGQMKTQMRGLLRRRDCTDDLVETFMQQGIARAQRGLRVPAMEKSELLTIGTYDGIDIPNDFLELKELTVNGGKVLDKKDLNSVLQGESDVGLPVMFARQGSKWRLAPAPLADTVIRVNYWGELTALSADADTNELSGIAPDLFIYSALAYAADYFVDKRASGFAATYRDIRDELQAQADMDELTGGAAVAPAYSYPSDT
jgi:hypothetical protein